MYDYKILTVKRDEIATALAQQDAEDWELVTAAWEHRMPDEPADDQMHLFLRKANTL
ncbi:MAG TPA: hypothetical protein VL426_00540 [Candidatus Binatia bacterium]|nr:hypothetical protein [Candidatus Binatia bacterium]